MQLKICLYFSHGLVKVFTNINFILFINILHLDYLLINVYCKFL